MARVHTEHQRRARKKNEKKSSGQPITQLRVMPMFSSGFSGPSSRVPIDTSKNYTDNRPRQGRKEFAVHYCPHPAEPKQVEFPLSLAFGQSQENMIAAQLITAVQHHRPLDYRGKLGEVAGPVVIHQNPQGLRGYAFDGFAVFKIESVEKMTDEIGNVSLVKNAAAAHDRDWAPAPAPDS